MTTLALIAVLCLAAGLLQALDAWRERRGR